MQAAVDLIGAVAFWGNEDNIEGFYHYGLFTMVIDLLENDHADVRVSAIELLCTLVEKRGRASVRSTPPSP